jgi:hypothetical protein
VVIKVELDDHGHATLLVHGEPEIIQEVATAVTLLLAADAEQIIIPDGDPGEESEEDLASSS